MVFIELAVKGQDVPSVSFGMFLVKKLLCKDPEFKEKVNEIVSLYINPPEGSAVICIDEKTAMQATERKNETVMPKCGKAGKYEHEYIRHLTKSMEENLSFTIHLSMLRG